MSHRSRKRAQQHRQGGVPKVAQHFEATRKLVHERGLRWWQAAQVVEYRIRHGLPLK